MEESGLKPQQMPPLVYIVLLNWNGWKDTIPCVESLRQVGYLNYQIVVVDNASTDGSEERIRAACPDATVLQSGANRGFAGGNNVGIRYAVERGADYVWLLNNDTLVRPDTLSALVTRAQSDVRIGFVGSKILYASQPDVVWFAGGTIQPRTLRGMHVPYDVPDDEQLPPAHEPDFLTGCSLLVRSSAICQIGGLPEIYFLYYEEVDWQYTARNMGWRTVYEPTSVVLHKVSASAGVDTPVAMFHHARSRVIFARRHFPRARRTAAVDLLRYQGLRLARAGKWKPALAACRGTFAGLRAATRWRGDDMAQAGTPGSFASSDVPGQPTDAPVHSQAQSDQLYLPK